MAITKNNIKHLVEAASNQGFVEAAIREVAPRLWGVENIAEALDLTPAQLERIEKRVAARFAEFIPGLVHDVLVSGERIEFPDSCIISVRPYRTKLRSGEPVERRRVSVTTLQALRSVINTK